MAEVCIDCLNEIYKKNQKAKDFILSKQPMFCEHCCRYKRIVIISRKAYYERKFKIFIMPIRIFIALVKLPYVLCDRKKAKNNR